MKEYDLMKILGYDFDPGIREQTGFWFDPQEWSFLENTWPSVYMLENDKNQPKHPFELITTRKLVRRILGMINAREIEFAPVIPQVAAKGEQWQTEK